MNALKNAAHLAALALWGLGGLLLSLKLVFGVGVLLAPLAFWLWFAGFVAVTSWAVSQFTSPLGALAVHAGAMVLLPVLPKWAPVGYLRYGYDFMACNLGG